jgi:hypothetical protein
VSRWDAKKKRRTLALAIGVPLLLALPLCALLRPELGSALAPAFGPWAGHLYGHSDCTMAHAAPAASLTLAALAGALGVGLALVHRRGAVLGLAVLSAIWSLCWSGAALLSVVNTTS